MNTLPVFQRGETPAWLGKQVSRSKPKDSQSKMPSFSAIAIAGRRLAMRKGIVAEQGATHVICSIRCPSLKTTHSLKTFAKFSPFTLKCVCSAVIAGREAYSLACRTLVRGHGVFLPDVAARACAEPCLRHCRHLARMILRDFQGHTGAIDLLDSSGLS